LISSWSSGFQMATSPSSGFTAPVVEALRVFYSQRDYSATFARALARSAAQRQQPLLSLGRFSLEQEEEAWDACCAGQEESPQTLPALGQEVEARYREGRWFPATLVEALEDSVQVKWHFDDSVHLLKHEDIRTPESEEVLQSNDGSGSSEGGDISSKSAGASLISRLGDDRGLARGDLSGKSAGAGLISRLGDDRGLARGDVSGKSVGAGLISRLGDDRGLARGASSRSTAVASNSTSSSATTIASKSEGESPPNELVKTLVEFFFLGSSGPPDPSAVEKKKCLLRDHVASQKPVMGNVIGRADVEAVFRIVDERLAASSSSASRPGTVRRVNLQVSMVLLELTAAAAEKAGAVGKPGGKQVTTRPGVMAATTGGSPRRRAQASGVKRITTPGVNHLGRTRTMSEIK
ncbi:unnamed protein product, partial [Polarella glacialis]